MEKTEMQNYVTGFMFTDDQTQVVLIKKCNPEWQKGLFNGVGGKIEPCENPFTTMIREFREEAGVVTTPSDWKLFLKLKRLGKYEVNFFFSISDSAFSAKTIETEEIQLVNARILPKNIVPNLSWLIPLAQDKRLSFDTPTVIIETKPTKDRISA